ncbi:HEPN domain-containing protein [Cetobacterium sp.]|uniref:HEPN domain-containing protein n=1 Tax=Cetobacterium sp. TaxID=2071632 RepID=UPI003F2DEC7E
MDKKDIALEWFKFANEDLSSAQFLLNKVPTPLEIICYHCQQSAEKYLKGFLLLNGEKLQRTHDLIFLNNICKKYSSEFENIEDDCLELIDYGVEVRYPMNIQLNDYDVKNALKSAEKIKQLIMERANYENKI